MTESRAEAAQTRRRRRLTVTAIASAAILAVLGIYKVTTPHTALTPPGITTGAPNTWHGNSNGQTPDFTTDGDWSLTYTYTCPTGEALRITEHGGPGDGATLAYTTRTGETATTYVHNSPGTHYLTVVTHCAWAVAINDMVRPPAPDTATNT